MNTAEADPAELERRAAATLAADAAEHGIDLSDAQSRSAFAAGFTVSLGWITAAHETGKIDEASFAILEELFAVALTSLKPAAPRER